MPFTVRTALAFSLAAAVVVCPAFAAKKKAAHHKEAPAPAATAEAPTLLGVSKDWTAYQANTGNGKVCYALSSPKSSEPKVVRDPAYIIISTWPGRNVKDELQVVPGYTYKEGETVLAQVGARKTEFFVKNDGKAGSAWVKDLTDEATLVRAMRGGSKLVISGASSKGTRTTDTYSLAGIATALDRAHTACGG